MDLVGNSYPGYMSKMSAKPCSTLLKDLKCIKERPSTCHHHSTTPTTQSTRLWGSWTIELLYSEFLSGSSEWRWDNCRVFFCGARGFTLRCSLIINLSSSLVLWRRVWHLEPFCDSFTCYNTTIIQFDFFPKLFLLMSNLLIFLINLFNRIRVVSIIIEVHGQIEFLM